MLLHRAARAPQDVVTVGTWIQDDGTEVVTDPETGEIIEDEEDPE